MKLVLSRWTRAALVCLVLFTAGSAFAGAALDFLKGRQEELTKHAKADNKAKLTETFDQLLDYDTLAKTSLDAEWDKLSEAERKTFRDLLVTLIRNAYTKNIKDTLDYEIAFTGQETTPSGELVHTVAKHKSDTHKEPISIDYRLHNAGGKWSVVDIITEGSSLVTNYRSQFRRIIKDKGFAGLIEAMTKKAKSQ